MTDDIKRDYREFLEGKVGKGDLDLPTVGQYIRALKRLENKIKKLVYNLSVPELENLHDRLLQNGDLLQWSIRYSQLPSSAVKQLIDYKQGEQFSDTPQKPEQQASIEEKYKDFVERKTRGRQTAGTYIRALKRLGKKIGKSVYSLSISELKDLHKRLCKGGDLHEFNTNKDPHHRGPSAAVNKLIEYKQEKQSPDTTLKPKQRINIKEDYKRFLGRTMKSASFRSTYPRALEKLEEKIGKSVYNLSISQLEHLYNDLRTDVDLKQFNMKTYRRGPSAAVGKLIKYKQGKLFPDTTPEPEKQSLYTQPELEEQIENYSVEQIFEDGCFLKNEEGKEDKESIEKMLRQLESKKNLTLQGPPGTGKTWLAKKLAFALMKQKNKEALRTIQFHPNLSYEDFIQGWRPDGGSTLTLANGPFLEMIKQAKENLDTKYVMVIEEINRGNPAQIFGEMLTLLEADKRTPDDALKLTYSTDSVYIPDNVYVIGTMNIADRSLASLDLALRRRFAFYDLEPTFGELWQKWVNEKNNIGKSFLRKIEKRLHRLNKEIEKDENLGSQCQIGHSYVTPPASKKITNPAEWFHEVVELQIIPLLKEYWLNDPKKISNARDILLPPESNDRTNG